MVIYSSVSSPSLYTAESYIAPGEKPWDCNQLRRRTRQCGAVHYWWYCTVIWAGPPDISVSYNINTAYTVLHNLPLDITQHFLSTCLAYSYTVYIYWQNWIFLTSRNLNWLRLPTVREPLCGRPGQARPASMFWYQIVNFLAPLYSFSKNNHHSLSLLPHMDLITSFYSGKSHKKYFFSELWQYHGPKKDSFRNPSQCCHHTLKINTFITRCPGKYINFSVWDILVMI